jgi:hypothetical protein
MVAYRFGRARPGQADESGPAWLRSAASAHFFFFQLPGFKFLCAPEVIIYLDVLHA